MNFCVCVYIYIGNIYIGKMWTSLEGKLLRAVRESFILITERNILNSIVCGALSRWFLFWLARLWYEDQHKDVLLYIVFHINENHKYCLIELVQFYSLPDM